MTIFKGKQKTVAGGQNTARRKRQVETNASSSCLFSLINDNAANKEIVRPEQE